MRHSLWLIRTSLLVTFVAGLAQTAAAQNGRISGLVNDETGHPIKAATITAEFPDAGLTMTATTDDKGRFSMIGLRGGRWNFMAQAPGFAPRAGSMAIRSGSPNPPITFALLKRGNVSGPLSSISGKDLQSELAAAEALFDQQKWDAAITAYKAIADKSAGMASVNLQIAAAYANKNDYPAAAAAYNELLKSDPANEQAAIGLGALELARGNVPTAEQALTKAADAPTAGAEVFCALGDVELAKGDADAADRWYHKAADADPSWGKPLYKLAQAAMKKGDQTSAASLMDKVVAVDPQSPEAELAKSALGGLRK